MKNSSADNTLYWVLGLVILAAGGAWYYVNSMMGAEPEKEEEPSATESDGKAVNWDVVKDKAGDVWDKTTDAAKDWLGFGD